MKTEVYTWRVSTELKTGIEAEARRQNVSVSALLDRVAREWLEHNRSETSAEAGEQARLHAAAERLIGTISVPSGVRSDSVRKLVRNRLARRYGR